MVPTTLELLAISAGLEFLEALGLTGTVFSDCQGLVKNLRHLHVPPADPRWPGYHLIRACVRHLTHPRRKLQWIRCHPNARGRPALGGTNLMGPRSFAPSPRSTPLNRGAHPPSVHHRGCHWPGRLALVHGGSRPSPRRPPPRGKHIITFLLPI